MVLTTNARKSLGLLLIPATLFIFGCERDVQRSGASDQVSPEVIAEKGGSEAPGLMAESPTNGSQGVDQPPVVATDSGSQSGTSISGSNSSSKTEEVKMKVDSSAARSSVAMDVTKFGFDKRKDFKNYMESRLDAIERNLESVSSASTNQGSPERGDNANKLSEQNKKMSQNQAGIVVTLEQLKKTHQGLEDRIGDVDSVKQQDWNAFRGKFRDDVVRLESSYFDLMTASK